MSLRLPADVVELIDRAAEATRQDRASFVIEAVTRYADEVLDEPSPLRLSDADYRLLTETLDNPPEPSPALVELLRRRPAWER